MQRKPNRLAKLFQTRDLPRMNYHVTGSGGIDIAYEIMGEGPPVLLIHGFGANRSITWRNTGWFDVLTRGGHQVIAMDCRGHGQSGRPHAPEDYGDGIMAADAFAVLSDRGIGSAHVMGYSMGAQLAIRLMNDHPAAVRRCVLAGIGESYFHPSPAINETIAQALESSNPATIQLPIAREFRSFCERAGDDLIAMAACMRRPRRIFSPQELNALPHHVLVVCGSEDTLAGAPELLAVAFARGEIRIVPKRNHHSTVGDRVYREAAISFFAQPDQG
jgi:pimeloyl-ACP methyl ester carboxylesterase